MTKTMSLVGGALQCVPALSEMQAAGGVQAARATPRIHAHRSSPPCRYRPSTLLTPPPLSLNCSNLAPLRTAGMARLAHAHAPHRRPSAAPARRQHVAMSKAHARRAWAHVPITGKHTASQCCFALAMFVWISQAQKP